MRTFSSYGPIDIEHNYYVPRDTLINSGYSQLIGENPIKGGHYITIWAPRQTGKSWIMQQVIHRIQKEDRFNIVYLSLQHLAKTDSEQKIIQSFITTLNNELNYEIPLYDNWVDLQLSFSSQYLKMPLILIMDEFDSLMEEAINGFARIFRNIHLIRQGEMDKATHEKSYLLHGVALVGVRSVLGIENVKGSPFNIQRSIHIPNLTYDEVNSMYHWYQQESGQPIESEVIDKVYYETEGHPGLVSWFGELLTDTYNQEKNKPISLENWNQVYAAASQTLPNNTIINIISKAKQPEYKDTLLELFKTTEKELFNFDDPNFNFLYMNGIIDYEEERDKPGKINNYIKFSSPFVQKRLFNRFSREMFKHLGNIIDPFEDLSTIITEESLNVRNLIKRYQKYVSQNKEWLFKNAPRRTDLKIFEAVYHFNLYRYLSSFLEGMGGWVYPEFPTGNGKVDILIQYNEKLYGIEVKSFTNVYSYQRALAQAAKYARRLKLREISLVLFTEYINDEAIEKFEVDYFDKETKVKVLPVFVAVG